MRELIGLGPEPDFWQEESVQAMVVWADKATNPMPLAPGPCEQGDDDDRLYDLAPRDADDARAHPRGVGVADASPAAPGGDGEGGGNGAVMATASTATAAAIATTPAAAVAPAVLAPIARAPLAASFTPYASILAVHQDCVAPGVALRDVRPPLTELTPLPPNFPVTEFPEPGEAPDGRSLRSVLLNRRTPTEFERRPIPRDTFRLIVKLALRGGTFFPMFPAGPHVALVRPLWIIHDVTGMNHGIWYYHPPTDAWSQIGRSGDYRLEAAYLSLEQPICGDASAVCFLFANVAHLTAHAGPDTYRLAHLEAGIVAQRIALAAASVNLGASGIGGFYDDDVRQFFGLHNSGWEPIYEIAIGAPADPDAPRGVEEHVDVNDDSIWRD
jgi:SagB-type dehydrogenase family enzyme